MLAFSAILFTSLRFRLNMAPTTRSHYVELLLSLMQNQKSTPVFICFLRFRVMPSRAFFVPHPAAAPAAPKLAAFPAAIIAGIATARGNMPPFCCCRRFLTPLPRCFLCHSFSNSPRVYNAHKYPICLFYSVLN